MDTLQLAYALSEAVAPHAYALGVFPRDMIPPHPCTYPSCLIANTDASTAPGKHWTAFYFESPYHVEFFDSFGHTPCTYAFHIPTQASNTLQYQSNFSVVCGQFCIYYLYYRARGLSLCDIQSMFTALHPDLNDSKVNCFAHKILSLPHLHNPAPCYCKQSCCSRAHA